MKVVRNVGGKGGIRTHGAVTPEKFSRLPRYDLFATSPYYLGGSTGIEPMITEPQSAVLPLHQQPHIYFLTKKHL